MTSPKQNQVNDPITDDDDSKIFHLLESYIDDFIALIQKTDKKKLLRLTRSILHAITDVFPGADITNSIMGSAISEKKLIQEGAWETRK